MVRHNFKMLNSKIAESRGRSSDETPYLTHSYNCSHHSLGFFTGVYQCIYLCSSQLMQSRVALLNPSNHLRRGLLLFPLLFTSGPCNIFVNCSSAIRSTYPIQSFIFRSTLSLLDFFSRIESAPHLFVPHSIHHGHSTPTYWTLILHKSEFVSLPELITWH